MSTDSFVGFSIADILHILSNTDLEDKFLTTRLVITLYTTQSDLSILLSLAALNNCKIGAVMDGAMKLVYIRYTAVCGLSPSIA